MSRWACNKLTRFRGQPLRFWKGLRGLRVKPALPWKGCPSWSISRRERPDVDRRGSRRGRGADRAPTPPADFAGGPLQLARRGVGQAGGSVVTDSRERLSHLEDLAAMIDGHFTSEVMAIPALGDVACEMVLTARSLDPPKGDVIETLFGDMVECPPHERFPLAHFRSSVLADCESRPLLARTARTLSARPGARPALAGDGVQTAARRRRVWNRGAGTGA